MQFTELNTGFSRASRSPALRRLAKLAPPASAREYLRHRSTASDKKTVPVISAEPKPQAGCGSCDTANCKTAKNRSKTRPKNNYSFNPAASLRRQRSAESTNHADKSRNPCHSGCEVAESEDNKNRTNTNRRTPPAQVLQASKNTLRPTEPIAGKKRGPGD